MFESQGSIRSENVWFPGSVVVLLACLGQLPSRGQRRRAPNKKLAVFAWLRESFCHLSTPWEISIFTIL